jgi:hypothetical protein
VLSIFGFAGKRKRGVKKLPLLHVQSCSTLYPKNFIRVDELAATVVDPALHGSEEEMLQDNQALVMKGREALKAPE